MVVWAFDDCRPGEVSQLVFPALQMVQLRGVMILNDHVDELRDVILLFLCRLLTFIEAVGLYIRRPTSLLH